MVVDDALQGVTDVARGRDLLAATAVHRLLQALLGLAEPRYRHHRLVLDPDGSETVEEPSVHVACRIARGGLGAGRRSRGVGISRPAPDVGLAVEFG